MFIFEGPKTNQKSFTVEGIFIDFGINETIAECLNCFQGFNNF